MTAKAEKVASGDPGTAQRFVRDLFTGELRQVPAGTGGRQIIYRERVHYDPGRSSSPWAGPDHISRPLSLAPDEVSPERIAHENEEARRHGTGAWYDPAGECHLPTRGSRSREMSRPKIRQGISVVHQDNDAGFGDFSGR